MRRAGGARTLPDRPGMKEKPKAYLERVLVPRGLHGTDMHLHTVFSDGRDPADLMMWTAAMLGLEVIAITDHLSGRAFPSGQGLDEYFGSIEKAAEAYPGLTVLKGVEGTVLDADGTVSVPDDLLERFDVVLVDVGWKTRGIARDPPKDRARLLENVRRICCSLCENPFVDIAAHPFNLGRLVEGFSLDWLEEALLQEIACAFRETGTAFEVMSDIWWWFPAVGEAEMTAGYSRILRVFHEACVRFTLGSDAHSHQGVGNLAYARKLLESISAA